MAGLNETEKSLDRMEKSLGNINKKLNETERILLSNSALASHLGFVDDTGIKQYVAEMRTLFDLYKSLKNINGIPEIDAYFLGLKYTLLQVSDTITNIKKNSKATAINTPQGTLPAGKKSEFAYDNYKFNSKAHDDYIRQPIGEIKGIIDKKSLNLDLSVTGLENSEEQIKKLDVQLDKFREKLLGDSDVMKNSLLSPEQVDAYIEEIKKAISVQLEFAKSFDNIAYGKEHLQKYINNDSLNAQLGRVSNYMLGNTEKRDDVSTFDINDNDKKSMSIKARRQDAIMKGKVSPLYSEVLNNNRGLSKQGVYSDKYYNNRRLSDIVDTSELETGSKDIFGSKPNNSDEAIDRLKKYNKLIIDTISKIEELRTEALATKKELAGTDNVKTYISKKKELGKNAYIDNEYDKAVHSDEVNKYLENDTKLKSLNNAKKLLKSKLVSGLDTETINAPVVKSNKDIGSEVGNKQLRSLLSATNTSELEQVFKFKPEIDKSAFDKMKKEALALSNDIPDDFGIKNSDFDIKTSAFDKMKKEALALSNDIPDDFGIKNSDFGKMKKEALALSNDIPDDFGARSAEYIGSYIANNEKRQNSDKKTAQIAKQTAQSNMQANDKEQQSIKQTSQIKQQSKEIEGQLAQQTASVEEQLAQQTASVEEQLDNKVTETKSKNKKRQISEAEKAKRDIIDASFNSGSWISAEKQSDIYRQHLDSAKKPVDQYKLKTGILNSNAKSTKDSEEEIYNAAIRKINEYAVKNDKTMPIDSKIGLLKETLSKVDNKSSTYNKIIKELGKAISAKERSSKSSIAAKDSKEEIYNEVIRKINEYAVKNDKTMPIDSKIGLLKEALSKVDNNKSSTYDKIIKELSKTISAKERSSKSSIAADTTNIDNQKNAIKSLMEETKNYVSTQETLSGKKMNFSDQASYYEQQANKMKQLAGESKEYVEILKLKNQAEAKAADETRKAAEKEKQAYDESLKAARQKITQGLNTIKTFADGINNAVNKVVSIIRTGIRLINRVISTTGKIIATLGKGIKSIITLFGNLGNRIRQSFSNGTSNANGFNGSINLLKGSITELNSKISLLQNAFNMLFNNSMVTNAKRLLSSIYSINTIGGKEIADNTIAWAKSMEFAFGLSARDLISGMQELNGVMYGLGMNAKNSTLASQNILIMGQYLASIGMAGGDTNEVISKLTSGMKGMTQAVDDLGISVRDAQMNSFLKGLKAQGGEFANIETDFSSLNEQARVYIRYASMINQFTDKFDITNFARGLDTITGRVQLFKSSVSRLTTILGTGLLNIFAKLTTYLIPLINYVTSLISKLFGLLHISVDLSSGMNDGEALNSVDNKLDTTGNKLDKVADKAKKAKGSLQSFDRVNNVTSSDSSKNKSGEDGFDYSKLMVSMLDGLNKIADDAAKSFADSLHDRMMKNLKAYRDKFIEYAKSITGRANFDLEFDWPKIKKSLVNIKDNIISLIKNWGTFSIEIALKIADDANIGKILTKITEFISAVTDLAVAFSGVLIPVLRNFYDEVLSPIVKLVGEKVANAFDKATRKLKGWTKYLKDNKPELIDEWTEKLKHFFSIVTGKESANPEDGVLGTVLEVLNKVGKVIEALTPIVLELTSAFGTFLKDEFLPWLNEKLEDLAEWLRENKDDIVEFLKEIGGFAWDSFKIFVDLIGKLVDFCVKHPTEVKAFLIGLAGIKIASWATSTAAGIGQLVFQLGLLNKLKGVNKILGGLGTGGTAAEVAGAASTAGAATETAAGGAAAAGGAGIISGLAKFGTLMGSGATTAGGVAAAGASSIAGIVGGIAGVGDGIKDLYDASKETNEEIKEQKNWSGGTKIGMVGAGAAAGAAIGSVVPGIGTAVGAAVGAGVGGVSAIFKGSDISEWLHDAWDNTLKPFFTETIPENFGKLVDGIGEFFTETIPETIGNIGEGIGTFFTEKVPGFFGNLVGGVAQFFTETVPETIGNIGEGIEVFFTETVPGFFGNLVGGVVQFFTEDVPYALGNIAGNIGAFFTETVPGFFGNLVGGVAQFFTEDVPYALGSIAGNIGTFFTETVPGFFSGLWENIKTFFTETIPEAVGKVKKSIKKFFTKTIPNKIKSLLGGIGDIFGGAIDWIKEKFSGIGSGFSAGYDDAVNKTSANTAKTVTSHAVGGSIAGGQLFIANENGQPELIGNIDSSPKTNVANNNMIIEAMTDGVFTGVYNALAEVSNQRSNVGGTGQNINLKIDGFGLIDSSTLSELARMLAPYNSSNSTNIADVGFSI